MSFPHDDDAGPTGVNARLSVVHVVASLDARHGGPSQSVVQLVDALAQGQNLDVTLLSQRLAGHGGAGPAAHANTLLAETASTTALAWGIPGRRELRRIAVGRRPALIHGHGLWLPINHWASQTGRVFGIPVVVHSRGMLTPWALDHRAWKKRVAMALFERRDLETASALIATSSSECDGIRRLGIWRPVAVIPNGVRIAPHEPASRDARRPGNRLRTVLFLSRVHPVKGLSNLLHAWSRLAPPNWRLRIAGPDDGGHLDEILALVRLLNLSDSVEYTGALDGDAKAAAYRDADLFVLPTLSENFGIVVAEALAHGVPVITTRGAPWEDLERHGCGWWVEVGPEPLAGAMREAMALTDEERRAMGQRGREYVRRYSWDEIARQTAEVYRWILGGLDRPDCVRID
jgi:glycosyltransferase involved in cell wall biosynthesis